MMNRYKKLLSAVLVVATVAVIGFGSLVAQEKTVYLPDESVALAGSSSAAVQKGSSILSGAKEFANQWKEKNKLNASSAGLAAETEAIISGDDAIDTMLMPVASGVKVTSNQKAEIDYSNAAGGYVMARFIAPTEKRLKVQVKGPTVTYTYDLPQGKEWTTFPLTNGDGSYQVVVYQNVVDSRYSAVLSARINVELADEFGPYLRPNQYVNYEKAPNTVATAKKLTAGVSDPMAKVEKVYNYVVKNTRYDNERARTVKSGYLPVLDSVLAEKKGICFDYAALMTGMLRSQGVPCRLVIGYAGTAYHAWISVWTAESGWIEGAIYFDGSSWHRMDPTYASTSNKSSAVMQFIATDSNYTTKYFY